MCLLYTLILEVFDAKPDGLATSRYLVDRTPRLYGNPQWLNPLRRLIAWVCDSPVHLIILDSIVQSIAGLSLDNSPVINMAIGFVKKAGAAKTVIKQCAEKDVIRPMEVVKNPENACKLEG
ncbi:hypothetical protein ACTXT7_005432 [Hymenolepis weldensis]